jgi:hypothetical protein
MQTSTETGNGVFRFFSPQMIAELKNVSIAIQALSERQSALQERITSEDVDEETDPSDAYKAAMDEIGEVEAELNAKEAERLRLGVMLTAQKLYERYSPFLNMAQQASGPVARQLCDVLRVVIGFADVMGVELKPERKKSFADAAWSRKSKLDAYVAEGFTREEAFQMILAEIKPPDYAALAKALSDAPSPTAMRDAAESLFSR